MGLNIHMISGLPRSGSTLLAAILRQNPAFQASVSTALADLVGALVREMSAHESGVLISSAQREGIVVALIEAYYAHADGRLVFDTNRRWCGMLPLISQLFPNSRLICCVRSPSWIIDSIERAIQRNPLLASRMFPPEASNAYSRTEKLIKDTLVGPSMSALRQAWFSEHAGRMVAVRYDSLVRDPEKVIGALYRG
jgi:sulfotransferase